MIGAMREMGPLHGRHEAVVRGAVLQITPAKPATGWLKWFKTDVPAVVNVRIDDEPYRKLQELLCSRTEGRGVTQTFGIGWDGPDQIPSLKDRVWVTFYYAGPLETFFQGAPVLSYKCLKILENEWDTREGELGLQDEPELALQTA